MSSSEIELKMGYYNFSTSRSLKSNIKTAAHNYFFLTTDIWSTPIYETGCVLAHRSKTYQTHLPRISSGVLIPFRNLCYRPHWRQRRYRQDHLLCSNHFIFFIEWKTMCHKVSSSLNCNSWHKTTWWSGKTWRSSTYIDLLTIVKFQL